MNDNKTEVYNELARIVGKEYVSIDKEDIVPYQRDVVSQALKLYLADYVVLPGSVEEVQGIARVANKYKVPVYPYAAGTNIGGGAVPRKGGIVLVTRRMDQIFEINEETMTATIGPGVTWSKLYYEAAKVGLEPLGVGGGPHSGTAVGNFALGGGNTGSMDMNETVSIEVVLPTGELLRTGSAAYMGHEKINPYCRVAWGPNITGVFRGSLGAFGIVTKLIRRLYPLREIQDCVQIGFDNISDCVFGMSDLVRLGVSRQIVGIDRAQAAITSAEPELTANPEEYARHEDSFPGWLVDARNCCSNEEQANIYRKLIRGVATKHNGTIVEYTGSTKRYLDELWGASATVANRYLRHRPQVMAAAMLPPSMIPEWRRRTLKILDDLDFRPRSFSGRVIEPRVWLSPWERNESYWFEQNVEFSPTDPVSMEKFRKFQRIFYDEAFKYGAAQIGATFMRRAEEQIIPTYVKLIRDIKHSLDPNGVFAPGQILKDM